MIHGEKQPWVVFLVLLLAMVMVMGEGFSIKNGRTCCVVVPFEKKHHHPSHPPANPKRRRLGRTRLDMSLVPLRVEEVRSLISVDSTPTALQYASYWGRSPRERYGRLVESLLVSVLGMIFSYCLSFVLGGFVATILGAIFLFWGVLTPQLKATQRNWEFLGGREIIEPMDKGYDDDDDDENVNRRGLYAALFLGHLQHVSVVTDSLATQELELEQFADYTMEKDELEQYTGNPYLLRVRIVDRQRRQLQLHARLDPEYLDLLSGGGAPVVAVLLSKSPQFLQLAALSDLYVPTLGIYIGDYPYLHRFGMENLLANNPDIWDSLLQEEDQSSSSSSSSSSYNGSNDFAENEIPYHTSSQSSDAMGQTNQDSYDTGTNDRGDPVFVRRRRRRTER